MCCEGASSTYLWRDVTVDGFPKSVKAMPPGDIETAVDVARVGVQVAALLPHATPIQAVMVVIQGLLERARQVSKNKEQLRLLVGKATDQTLFANKASKNGLSGRNDSDTSIQDSEGLFLKIFDYTYHVHRSSRWKNFIRVNKVKKMVDDLDSELSNSFRSLVYHVVGSMLEESPRRNLSCRTPYQLQFLERFERSQIKNIRAGSRRRTISREVDTVTTIAQLFDHSFILIKQYKSEDSGAAIEAFTDELSKHRYINNVAEQIFGCSPHDPPVLVYRVSPPEQRLPYWDVYDLNHYALILALLPQYLQDWRNNFKTVPLRDEEYLDLEHWLRDLAITFAAKDSNSICKLTYVGELPNINAREDTDATWESFLSWLSWSLLLWAPEFDDRIQRLVCGLQWESPEPHQLDRMTREHPLAYILDRLHDSAWVNGRKPNIEINGKAVALNSKHYYRMCNEAETFVHRYTDTKVDCKRTEWIVWYKNEERGFRSNSCNCWGHNPAHEPDISEEFDRFLVKWSA